MMELLNIFTSKRKCKCIICERGRRYYRNTEGLPKKEREWMRGFYDAVMNMEEEQAMREVG